MMTNDIVPANLSIPAHLQERVGVPSTIAQSMGGGIGAGAEFPRISIKGGRFRIIDGGVESLLDATSLEVIVVGANPGLSKLWYATAWNPDAEPSAPDCYSLEGVKPHPDSTQPQNDLCASCPQNAWGSRVTQQGTKVKACADQKRLAVVPADDAEGSIFLLQVTPAALKGLNQYQTDLSRRGIAPEIVRTVVSFDTSASYPKLTFGFGGFVDEKAQPTIDGLLGSDKVLEITGEAAAVNASGQAPAEAAPAAAEPVVETPAPAEPEPTPAPKPVAKKKSTGFGAATTVEAPKAPEIKAETTQEEPEAAPAAPADASTAALADEITALMEEVSDDA